jgi:hypothetical protein
VTDPFAAPPVLPGNEVIELRPKWAQYKSDVRSRRKWILPAVVLLGARLLMGNSSRTVLLITVIGTVLAVGVVLVLVRAHVRTTRVILSPGRVERTGALVRDRVLEVGRLRGVLATIVQPTASNLTVVLHDDHEGSIRLSDALWTAEDLATIAQHAGVPLITDPARPIDVEKMVPGSMPMYLRRPFLFAFGFAFLLIAVVIGGVVGWFALNDEPPFDASPAAVSAQLFDA